MVDDKDIQRKEEWLAKRRNFITGTDISCILGINPYGSKLSVWLDKKGLAEPVAETEPMRWGKKLEGKILEAYAEAMDCRLVLVDGYDLKTNDNYPRLGASLDGWNSNIGIPVDAKNIRWPNEKWGDNGTDEFPDYYKAQLQVQMMVMNAPMAHLAVLFSGQEFRVYQMQYDDALAKKIVDAVDSFWPIIEGDEMPDPGSDEKSTQFIKERFKKADPEADEKAPTEEVTADARKLVDVKAKIKALTEMETELSNRIKVFMGNSSVVTGLCSWKNAKDKETTDWKSIAEELLADTPEEKKSEILKRYTKTAPGARTLRITAKF